MVSCHRIVARTRARSIDEAPKDAKVANTDCVANPKTKDATYNATVNEWIIE